MGKQQEHITWESEVSTSCGLLVNFQSYEGILGYTISTSQWKDAVYIQLYEWVNLITHSLLWIFFSNVVT